jgi:hypothetical protein
MGAYFLMAGSVIAVSAMLTFRGIRLGTLSVVQASIIMMIIAAATGAALEASLGKEAIQGACVGSLLGFGFGLSMFAFGRTLEQERNKRQK